jgi:hypothetical protein
MSPVRGYAEWNPKSETLAVIQAVRAVLEEYKDYLPVSLRQIFYRLVAEYGYDKTEAAYNRLGNHVARARRAQLLPFDAIHDGQGSPLEARHYTGEEGFWAEVEEHAGMFHLNRMAGQPVRIEVWAEAGTKDQLFKTTGRYGIPVYSSRGYTSVTNTYAVARRALKAEVPTILLHIGDHDPSGVGIYETLIEDASMFLVQERYRILHDEGADGLTLAQFQEDAKWRRLISPEAWYLEPKDAPSIRAVRVALSEEQVDEYGIETAPPKPSDSRSKTWAGETAQAEALPPDLLARILTDAIEAELDMDLYEETVSREAGIREELLGALEEVRG